MVDIELHSSAQCPTVPGLVALGQSDDVYMTAARPERQKGPVGQRADRPQSGAEYFGGTTPSVLSWEKRRRLNARSPDWVPSDHGVEQNKFSAA